MFWNRPRRYAPVIQHHKVSYPSGLAVETTDGKMWYIKGNTKFSIPSVRVLHSWNFNSLATAIPEVLVDYKVGGSLGFRDGTVIENMADTKNYLISESKRRHITNPDAFDKYGLDRDCVVEVSADEANLHDDGEEIN